MHQMIWIASWIFTSIRGSKLLIEDKKKVVMNFGKKAHYEIKKEKQAGFCMLHNIRLLEEQHRQMMKKRKCETCKHFIKIERK